MSDQILRIDGASSSVPTQYHHFIPQFILKNFAHKYKPPKGKSNARAPRKPGLKLFKGDLALNHVDLTSEEPKIKESPVKRMLGMPDMYRDTTKPATEQHVVEQMLSRLESDASLVFRRITTVFEKGDGGIWLTRGERNLIRKFIFLMKYRNSKFHRRFYHETGASYEANDKHELLAYMRERGFSRPIDVWLHNMKTIIELDMDNEQRWMSELPQRMFPMDARWAIMNMESMFMNICYPSAAASEFIVTDNSYGVHEGPTNVAVDPETGELVDMGWCNFHEFAPISPRLMIVLRSSLLPSPSEDVTPWDKAQRDQWRKLAVDDVFGEDAQSLLGDLNIQKPENNYTEMIQGRRYVIPTEDGCLKSNHKFFFSFFAIETRQVNIINGIFFENASRCTSLVFKTGASFLDTLEFYMTSSDSNPFRKQVTLIPGDRNLILVKKLAAVMDQLGSTKTPTWDEISPSDPHSPTALMDIWDKWVRIQSKQLQALPDENPTEFKRTYQTLGEPLGQIPATNLPNPR